MVQNRKIVLASGSPRRRDLLRQIGLEFEVRPSEVDEPHSDGPPEQLAETLAVTKCRAVASQVNDSLVIAADTIVVVAGDVLGKPGDEAEAKSMLRRLSGRWHHVITGIAIYDTTSGAELVGHEVTRVKFRELSEDEIANYVSSGEPMDKAGAYGAQGLGAVIIEGIEGCYFNVVGLPLARLANMLKFFEVRVI